MRMRQTCTAGALITQLCSCTTRLAVAMTTLCLLVRPRPMQTCFGRPVLVPSLLFSLPMPLRIYPSPLSPFTMLSTLPSPRQHR